MGIKYDNRDFTPNPHEVWRDQFSFPGRHVGRPRSRSKYTLREALGVTEIPVFAEANLETGPTVGAVKPAEVPGHAKLRQTALCGIRGKIAIVVLNAHLNTVGRDVGLVALLQPSLRWNQSHVQSVNLHCPALIEGAEVD